MYDALAPVSGLFAQTSKVLNKVSNFHRGLLTEYNPVFMLTNAIKDVQDVFINSQHPAKTYSKIPEAFSQICSKGYWYQEYMANGGAQNTYFDKQSKTFTEESKGIKVPLEKISRANGIVEATPRLAEYIASREAGRSVEVSMLDAARVTTNFAAGGDVTKFLNRNGATFLNASVQGLMQNVRNIREAHTKGLKGWAALAGKFVLAAVPGLLLNNLLWDDDEDYEELSDHVKQNYYVIAKYADGQFVRIPKGRVAAVIQDAAQQVVNATTGNDEADLENFIQLVINNLAPNNPVEDNILAPVLQAAANKTWYGGDLVPERLQDLPAAEQFDESTDKFSKWLGEKLNISPTKIHYLLDQYSGGVGDVVLPFLTPEAESGLPGVSKVVAPVVDKFTSDSVMENQNVTDFYGLKDELTTKANSVHATDEDILRSKFVNSVSSDIGDLYKLKREIQNGDLSDSEKYAKVREVQQDINTGAADALEYYTDVTIDGVYATVGHLRFRKNDEGIWKKLDEEQLARQDAVTSTLEIQPGEYWSRKEEYDYAYDYPSNYAVARAVGGYDAYKRYRKGLSNIKADKDQNGETIDGSRKKKVQAYINGLDAGYYEKLILWKCEYPSDDSNNKAIIQYLNSRDDLSRADVETILKKLGFKVSASGKITWD